MLVLIGQQEMTEVVSRTSFVHHSFKNSSTVKKHLSYASTEVLMAQHWFLRKSSWLCQHVYWTVWEMELTAQAHESTAEFA